MKLQKKNIFFSAGKSILAGTFIVFVLSWVFASRPELSPSGKFLSDIYLSGDSPNVILPYPFDDRISDEQNSGQKSPLYMGDPSNINKSVEYDPESKQYDINESIGKMFYRNPSYLTFDEYVDKEFRQSQKDYFMKRSDEDNVVKKSALIPQIKVESEVFDLIFGGNTVDIRPNGSAELSFGVRRSTNENPSLPIRSQRPPAQFDFDQKIQMNVVGHIGDKLKITTSYNTQSQFDFENQMKIEYTGYDDDILKKIELGNVSLPLTGSLITGSQSLFGIKTVMQFGRLNMTSIYSQQKGEKKTVESQGGAQTTFFEVKGDQYEANKHYFLSQYFKDNYDTWLAKIPDIRSPINISRVEVWVTKKTGTVDNIRNVVALMDLGEKDFFNQGISFGAGIPITLDSLSNFPSNFTNNTYRYLSKNQSVRTITTVSQALQPLGYKESQDFEKLEARLLPASDYTINPRLGYISLNLPLNPNEVLAVSYEYTASGETYRVGEFSTGGITAPSTLIVKLIKGTIFTTKLPTWDLMLKNIYSIGAFQLNKDDFKLQVMYKNASTGIPVNYIPAGTTEERVNGVPLIRVLSLDRLNTQNDPFPDGNFDFVEGVTINSNKGRVIFPVREPFGSYLRSKFDDQAIANNYAYDFLYDSTKTRAQQDLEHNRFSLKGSYKSTSSSELNLGAFNIPSGSVTVTAGGQKLVENSDYTVDYNMGKVRIINPAYLNSNTPVQASFESNSFFNQQTKTLFGTRLDYIVNKDVTLGGTILRLNERPITQKVNVGDESIKNTIWGVDGTYKKDSRFITKMVDALPLYSTKEKSSILLTGEFAQLVPGHSRQIGTDGGTAYIDDFEGAKSTIDIKSASAWAISSVPEGQPTFFPEAQYSNDLISGKNRARLAWYVIDPFFYDDTKAPVNIQGNKDEVSNHFSRQVPETEIFPNKENPNGATSQPLSSLNLAFYPKERGLYNFDGLPSLHSRGLETDGSLKSPEARWGGMMRKLETTDFEATNVEFLEFWMLDPFIYNQTSGGDLYFNLGSISEDILKDGIKTFENGLPTVATPVDVIANPGDSISRWGRVPVLQALTNAFDNDETSRPFQDVGFDGLRNEDEQVFFQQYLNEVQGILNPVAFDSIFADPAGDKFHHFRGTDYDNRELSILDRYKLYNGVDGNSPTAANSPESYPTSSSTLPDLEDVNKDGMFNESESYFQYRVSIRPGDMEIGKNYITDIRIADGKLANQTPNTAKWYQFKIPVSDPKAEKINGIEDFHSIGFVRMFLKGFSDSIICRFAKLQLVRSDWRRFGYDVGDKGGFLPIDNDKTTFDVTTVSYEENGSRKPIHYDLPPDIERTLNPSANTVQRQNEQSISLKVCDLEDGRGRAAYKNISYDVRNYKKLRLFVHGEDASASDDLKTGDLTVFVRLGSDFTDNYYEYEIPLTPTRWGNNLREQIWPDANEIIIDLEKLYLAKIKRNELMAQNPSKTLSDPYTTRDGIAEITVVGSPRLNEVRTVMLGVRNPYRYRIDDVDDGLSKCAEVWFDELRVTDFEDKGGWAANARMTTKLADLGTASVSGTHKSYNWGTLEQKMNDRSKVKETSYDASTSIELGKFLPEKVKLRVPMFAGYGEAWKRPKYDPNDPDVPFQLAAENISNDSVRKEFIHKTEDYSVRRSLNFTNVKLEKSGGGKAHFYDVSNVSVTYAYTDLYNRSESIEYKKQKEYRGGLAYAFSPSSQGVSPFAKSPAVKSPWLKLIKDFNFAYIPNSFAFRTDLNRQYTETLLRNTTGAPIPNEWFINKNFMVTRAYDFKFDPAKSIKTDFQATNISRVDEKEGRVNKKEDDYKLQVDTIKKNLFGINSPLGGRTTEYKHNGNISYAIPVNKFPAFDWISPSVKYGFEYSWLTAPLVKDEDYENNFNAIRFIPDTAVGNTIKNSQTKQGTANLNFTTLYNKIGYFKRVNQKKPGQIFPKILKPIKTKEDTLQAKRDSSFQVSVPGVIARNLTKGLMMVKTGSFTYSETKGTLLPGYKPKTQLLGMDDNFNAPTSGFIFGSQDTNIVNTAGDKGWITKDTSLSIPLTRTHLENLQAKLTLEPASNLKVDLTGTRNFSRNSSEYYRYQNDNPLTPEDDSGFDHKNPTESGNYSISFLSYKTAFEKQSKKDDYKSEAFEDFKDLRKDVSQKLGSENPNANPNIVDTAKFVSGYSGTSQEVLIPAFLAAYSGNSTNKYIGDKNQFPKIPLPNWRVTYDGFSKMEWSKKYFNSVTLNHQYRSTYSINSYNTSTEYRVDPVNQYVNTKNDTGNFRSKYEIAQVSISEQFSPLFGVDMNWKSSFTTKFEYKRDRNLSLSLTNIQLNETRGSEYVVGVGYKYKQFKVPFKINRKTVRLKNDLIIKTDFSLRKSLTITRQLIQESVQTTGGTTTYKAGLSIDYMVNERFNVRLFYDRTRNVPELSSSFPTTNWNGGFSIRFTISG